MRFDNRAPDQLRPITIQRHFTGSSRGSVYIKAGRTTVLCTASVEESVPPWKRVPEGQTPTGWVTAEYNMLPGSTSPRKRRDRNKVDGRTTEIQRIIGRSLRAVVDFEALGERTIVVDCDVLEADGGTRTLSITGGFMALADALTGLETTSAVLTDSVAAVSVGLCGSQLLLDLDYEEDSSADVDLNVVMTGRGELIEVQGTAEGQTFSRHMLDQQLDLATLGITELTNQQRLALGSAWPLDAPEPNC
jgi:ribonuclease PH